MTNEPRRTAFPVAVAAESADTFNHPLSWRAIIAGAVAGLSIHILLTMLGLGLGIGSLEPVSDENPVAKLGMGAAIAWCVSALIALWSGGYVAGRFIPVSYKRSGSLHGFLVWSVATVLALLITTSTAGALIGGAAKIVGAAAKPVAAATSGVTDLAKDAIKQNTDAIGSYVDEALQSRGQNTDPASAVRAKREIGYALTQLFAPGSKVSDQEKRAAVTRALTQAGVSEQDANRMLTEWTASAERMKADFDRMKTEAEAKAREAGEKASDAVGSAAIWTFVAFLIGAIVASIGGKCGAAHLYKDDDTVRVDTR